MRVGVAARYMTGEGEKGAGAPCGLCARSACVRQCILGLTRHRFHLGTTSRRGELDRSSCLALDDEHVLLHLDGLIVATDARRAAFWVDGARSVAEHAVASHHLQPEALEAALRRALAVEAALHRALDTAPRALGRAALEALGHAIQAALRRARDATPLALGRAALDALRHALEKARAVRIAWRTGDAAARALWRAAAARAARTEGAQLAALAVADKERLGELSTYHIARQAKHARARTIRVDYAQGEARGGSEAMVEDMQGDQISSCCPLAVR